MKTFNTFIVEGISNIVYHFTYIWTATEILKSNKFKLTAPVGADAMLKGKKQQMFYLSTTRSKGGSYHNGNIQGVVIELDGRKLAQNYSGQPIDYWGREFRKVRPDKNEMEDRIFHSKQVIPNATKYIKSLHVLLPVTQAKPPSFMRDATPKGTVEADLNKNEKTRVRKLWLEAKKKGIPIYFYDTPADWVKQRKPIDLKVAQLVLQNDTPQPWPPKKTFGRADGESMLSGWVELIKKPVGKKLSDRANRNLATVKWKVIPSESLSSFSADFHNEKKHKDAAKIIQFMKKQKLKTFRELLDYLDMKWQDTKTRSTW